MCNLIVDSIETAGICVKVLDEDTVNAFRLELRGLADWLHSVVRINLYFMSYFNMFTIGKVR